MLLSYMCLCQYSECFPACSLVLTTNRWKLFDMLLFLSFLTCLYSTTIAGLSYNSSNSPFLLANNQPDICLSETWIRAKGDCLLDLIELYYGDYRSACSNFAEMFASENCSGCPWSRLNATKLSSLESSSVEDVRDKVRPLFRSASEECRVAREVERFSYAGRRIWMYGGNDAVLLLIATSVLALDQNNSGQKFVLNGFVLPEQLFMCVVWLIYNFGSVLLSAAIYFYHLR